MSQQGSVPDGSPIMVEPLFVQGKTEAGEDVQVDIMRMLATDPSIRKTWQTLWERAFAAGAVVDNAGVVGFVYTDLNQEERTRTPFYHFVIADEDDDTYIGDYSPEVHARED